FFSFNATFFNSFFYFGEKSIKKVIMKKSIYIKTFGCQMNDRDTEALLGLFLDRGYTIAASPQDAGVIFVNTCSVRKHAEDRAISFLGTLKKIYNENKTIIGVIGCMAKYQGRLLVERMPYLNIICSPARLYYLPEYVEKVKNFGIKIVDLDDSERPEAFYESSFLLNKDHAQVVISTGCSNYCSYCVVPYVRGNLRLRKPQKIIEEIKKFLEKGVKKITLLGQNVNDYIYKKENIDFVKLLEKIASIKEIEQIDFITSHPKNTSQQLFKVMADYPNIKKHLHLPFQAGSDRILKLMNRGYTQKDYLLLVEDFYKIVNGSLSTDVIVGFPTESKEDFLKTKKVLETVKFKYAYIFKYSPRPNTKAAKLADDVSNSEKERRHRILLNLQKKISSQYKS
ncbi:MAG: tRNA (N6-isopentenyl adenosine(37)-C2)-methylthiotransferase MiaB, partial [Candidatus Omnitrophica bacterium]|nr:tRNA (N6-isopentenyl adenosine(37)-C2)-methylthiotransferase MiaB [Candidatus Omnitrophota bacterium]